MRIIAGKYKGRVLHSWKATPFIRPMSDKVKECLFNVLSPYLFEGFKVLDLFSGTGNLAFEALSRGAGTAHAIEKQALSLSLIQKNSQKLGLSPPVFSLHKKNVFSVLKRLQKSPAQALPSLQTKNLKWPVFDLILMDPPFRLQKSPFLMTLLTNSFLVDSQSLIVIETNSKEELQSSYNFFGLWITKDFKDKRLYFYKNPKR